MNRLFVGGMGGSYSLTLPGISAPMLERKAECIKNTDVPLVLTDCPDCVMQIRGGLERQHAQIEILHTVEKLAERLAENGNR